ncbi:MAG: flagellar biosynthesis protein FlhB [Alphaproteobacteria bacterium]|nr:flagellar biosynthesis protein FlhB [Alphaproteobacteria bacterium]
MAEDQGDQDDSQKTEEATAQRLLKAREKGQLAFSKEVNHWMTFLGLFLTVSITAPFVIREVAGALKPFFMAGQLAHLEGFELLALIRSVLFSTIKPMFFVFLTFIIASLLAGFMQTQFLISAESIKPNFSKISLLKGLKRIFSVTSLVEFGKGLLKIVIVSAIFVIVLIPDFGRINQWSNIPVGRIFEVIQTVLIKLLLIVLAVFGLIAGLDYFYQRFSFLKKMRMSKQDIKDEHKESDGDPAVKRRLAELRKEKFQQQGLASAIPEASVIITNPTHFAVALKYSDDMSAPKCIAKGQDLVALKMRELGGEHNVPIIEDPPLARALFAGIEVGQEVPEKYYFAVARVIRYISGMDKRYRGVEDEELAEI